MIIYLYCILLNQLHLPVSMRRLKVFDYTWHIPHQFDMFSALQDKCDFFLCLNAKKQWDQAVRPIPPNVNFVYNYTVGCYDLAILHIDQQVIVPGHQKRQIFEEFDDLIKDIPKIVINHGTPVFPERFHEIGLSHLTLKEMQAICIEMVKCLVNGKPMVVNSYDAASDSEWGFGTPIIHGMDADFWKDLKKEPRVFTALAPFGFDYYYNRKCMIAVSDILYKKYGHTLAYAKINIDTSLNFSDYQEYLGKSLIYLDTSYRTPMNRARTEAFLSGCCVVQVEGAHDLIRWAKEGENIIIVPDDPDSIAKTLVQLIEERYLDAIEIGQNGKEMAKREFNIIRYRNDWMNFINNVITV